MFPTRWQKKSNNGDLYHLQVRQGHLSLLPIPLLFEFKPQAFQTSTQVLGLPRSASFRSRSHSQAQYLSTQPSTSESLEEARSSLASPLQVWDRAPGRASWPGQSRYYVNRPLQAHTVA